MRNTKSKRPKNPGLFLVEGMRMHSYDKMNRTWISFFPSLPLRMNVSPTRTRYFNDNNLSADNQRDAHHYERHDLRRNRSWMFLLKRIHDAFLDARNFNLFSNSKPQFYSNINCGKSYMKKITSCNSKFSKNLISLRKKSCIWYLPV